MLYEMNSEVLDHATEIFRESRDEDEEPNFPIPEVVEVFKEPSTKQTLMDLMVSWCRNGRDFIDQNAGCDMWHEDLGNNGSSGNGMMGFLEETDLPRPRDLWCSGSRCGYLQPHKAMEDRMGS